MQPQTISVTRHFRQNRGGGNTRFLSIAFDHRLTGITRCRQTFRIMITIHPNPVGLDIQTFDGARHRQHTGL